LRRVLMREWEDDGQDSSQFTYFPRLQVELDETVGGSGVLGGLIGRLFGGTGGEEGVVAKKEDDVASVVVSGEEPPTSRPAPSPSTPTPSIAGVPLDPQREHLFLISASESDSTSLADSEHKHRLSWLFRVRNSEYEKGEFRRYWMPDSTGRECYECQVGILWS
jgi:hypothetical protein